MLPEAYNNPWPLFHRSSDLQGFAPLQYLEQSIYMTQRGNQCSEFLPRYF